MKIFKKKTWWTKEMSKWTGKDSFKASLAIGGVTALLTGIPVVGMLLKEWLDY